LHKTGKGNIRVGEATRARILEAARELGYVANPVARSLSTGRNGAVGVLLPYVSTLIYHNPFCEQLLSGVTDELVRSRCDLLLHTSLGDAWQHAEIDRIRDPRVDGIVFAVPRLDSDLVSACWSSGFPCIPVDYPPDRDSPYSINPDNVEGARLATQHLLDLGHRRIVHFHGMPEIYSAGLRAQGFRAALERAGLPVTNHSIVPSGYGTQDGYHAMQSVLQRPRAEWPTAVVACNDLCANGALRALAEAGLRVPDDMSLVGFDDSPFAEGLNPPLTTVHVPTYTMGVLASEMLLAVVERREIERPHLILPVKLRVRASTKACE
jgi:LacI family transcriptional regulator